MKARAIANAAGRGMRGVAPIVGTYLALTMFVVVGFAVTPTRAEVGTRLQKERSFPESQNPPEQASYGNIGGAQFFGPPRPEKASTEYGIRFIHPDSHLYNGHRPYSDVNHPNIADGGAMMFNWTFGK